MKAGIVIDNYKLPVFEEVLKREGFEYEQHPGITKDTITLTVTTDSAARLKPFVEEADKRARAEKRKG